MYWMGGGLSIEDIPRMTCVHRVSCGRRRLVIANQGVIFPLDIPGDDTYNFQMQLSCIWVSQVEPIFNLYEREEWL